MRIFPWIASLAAAMAAFAATPASAQFFLKPVDLSGARVTGDEPGMVGQAMAGATPAELDAALVWNLRAALNVAALQCSFAPTLFIADNYNGMLKDRETELTNSYKVLGDYFNRTAATKKAGQAALDQFGTRVYSGFSTVGGQLSFCHTAADIGRDIQFAPKTPLATFAHDRMYELRRSLLAWGDQVYRGNFGWRVPVLPNLADECWDDGEYRTKRCGPAPISG